MSRVVTVCSGVFGLAVALYGSGAFAQSSTNCMDMGSGMVHCDTMNMAPSGNSSADNDGNRQLGIAIHNLIFGDSEKAFRIKVGKLMAAGDCHGAVRLALEGCRLELGQSISETCHQQVGAAAAPPSNPQTNYTRSAQTASDTCTEDKIRYALSIGVDCHALGAAFPRR